MAHPTSRRVRGLIPIAAMALGIAVGVAPAQIGTPPAMETPHVENSGVHENTTNAHRMVWQTLVHKPDADWIQVHLDSYSLPGTSYVELTGFKDRFVQKLDRRAMQAWFPATAYFNGDAVIVRLFAGPNTRGAAVSLVTATIGLPIRGNDTICGNVDDRVFSTDRRACRLMPIGCTGWLATPKGWILTAGHCQSSSTQVAQFNVPISLPSGQVQHPPPQDQYAIGTNLGGEGSGTGCDYGAYDPGVNSLNQKPLANQGQYFTLATTIPPTNATIRITGYGTASGTRNQAQKTHTGPLVSLGSGSCGPYRLRYAVDTTGGNSGSPVINEATGEAIGIHTHGGCTSSGGSNSGTAITNARLQAIVNPQPPTPVNYIELPGATSSINSTQMYGYQTQAPSSVSVVGIRAAGGGGNLLQYVSVFKSSMKLAAYPSSTSLVPVFLANGQAAGGVVPVSPPIDLAAGEWLHVLGSTNNATTSSVMSTSLGTPGVFQGGRIAGQTVPLYRIRSYGNTSSITPTTPLAISSDDGGELGRVEVYVVGLAGDTASPTIGSTVNLTLESGLDAGRQYVLGLSFGAGPTPLGSRQIDLSVDPLLVATVNNAIPSILANARGTLDAVGEAAARFNVPSVAGLRGVRIHAAFVTLDPGAPSGVRSISKSFIMTIR